MINKKRMIRNFIDLVKIDSVSGKEKQVAHFLNRELKKLGAKTFFDGAAKKASSNCGNLIGKFKGDKTLPPFLLSAHMDTVPGGEGINPIVKKDRIISSGNTILGADCKSGIAVILEVLSVLKEKRINHPPIETVFSVCEEIGLLGAKFLDYSKIKARYGLVFDSEKPINEVVTNSPAADKIEIEIYGKAAHAGVCPEKGISAIKIASQVISQMKLGRIDNETTANIGIIKGGEATNIITPVVKMVGEARSHKLYKLNKQTKHMKDCVEKVVSKYRNGSKSRYLFIKNRSFANLCIEKSNPVLESLKKSMTEKGMKMKTVVSGGGTDANIFYGHNIKTPILATGMRDVHTPNEYLLLNEFFACAELTLKTIITTK